MAHCRLVDDRCVGENLGTHAVRCQVPRAVLGAAQAGPEREPRPMMPEPSPVPPWAALAGQAGAEGEQPRSWPNPERPSGSGPEVRQGAPSPPLLVLSDPRFERIEGMVEGTG